MGCMQAMEQQSQERKLGTNALDTMSLIMKEQVAMCKGTTRCPSNTANGSEQGLFFANGPFWLRHYNTWAKPQFASTWGCEMLEEVLDKVGAKQVVVGHTIQVRLFHVNPELLRPMSALQLRTCRSISSVENTVGAGEGTERV
jgi:hypothetical protein